MREQCAPAELFPDTPTRPQDLTWVLFEADLMPLIEDITHKLENETQRMLKYQCALWVL